jgi:uncharacterized membrane protein YidH (DUF202 family)
MHYLVIVAVATNKSKTLNYERNSQQRLNLKETSRIERTILANQTTVLAFRTAIFFFVAGLSTEILKIENNIVVISIVLSYCIRYFLIVNFLNNKMITENRKHIGIIN